MANRSSSLVLEPLDLWNDEDDSDLARSTSIEDYNVAIAGRDWTVETMVQQVRQGNIDLDPAFQRRNAWRDYRRSRLLESFILGFPVPQIVLAEHPRKKKSFIVIDGKQRLSTVAGLFLPDFRPYWTQPRFTGLNVLKDLNGVTLDAFLADSEYVEERRQLANADVRTTILTGFSDEAVLYDIFYRINTGSVPLSTQELRQVLNRGPFAQFLLEVTSQRNPLWDVLGITAPDSRLRDVELLLRLVAWRRHSDWYVGNMKPFLDRAMQTLNRTWPVDRASAEALVQDILSGVSLVHYIFGSDAGRKFKDDRFEASLNRAVFEVQAYFFSFPDVRDLAKANKKAILEGFKRLARDQDFLASTEATTKSIENYNIRFSKYRAMLADATKSVLPQFSLGRKDARE